MRRQEHNGLLALPSLTFLAVIFALPLLLLLFKSFQIDGQCSIREYRLFFSDDYNLTVLWRTLRLALIIAYPTAIAMSRARGGWLSVFLVAMVLPMSVRVVVKALAWSIIFRTRGVLDDMLMGLGITDAPIRMLFTETALIVGERQQTLSMLTARSFLYLRNEALGASISSILLIIALSVVLGSSWLANRLGARS